MKLLGISVRGFRRFADENNVRLLEPLIALVGPNEAGKTSFLRTIEIFFRDGPISERDRTRRVSIESEISGIFEIEEEDKAALRSLGFSHNANRCKITKKQNGEMQADLIRELPGNTEARKSAHAALSSAMSAKPVIRSGNQSEQDKRKTIFASALQILDSDEPYYRSSELSHLKKAADLLGQLGNLGVREVDNALNVLRSVIHDDENSLARKVTETLVSRLPIAVLFDDDSRALTRSYDLSTSAENPPAALANLARLAKLNLRELLHAMRKQDGAHRQEILDAANTTLKDAFSRAWVRPDVFPKITADGTTIEILVSTPDRPGLSAIDERSDGLRWFIALLAFLSGKEGADNAILLIDEAERHLSYDAQANLVEVLEEQKTAKKVIYTTHSAGCLPSDLGTSIRPIIPLDGERSKIENAFWTKGKGFSPLLLSMGLGSLAFTPARNVMICEGASECILLPTLLREANGADKLYFQIAPGASNASSHDFTSLLAEGGRVIFFLDGDKAGRERKKMLTKAGAATDSVKTLKDFSREDLTLEELVQPEIYVRAFNDELRRWQGAKTELSATDLPEIGRAAAVEKWCAQNGLKPVDKTVLCQTIAGLASEGNSIAAENRRAVLKEILLWADTQFKLDRS